VYKIVKKTFSEIKRRERESEREREREGRRRPRRYSEFECVPEYSPSLSLPPSSSPSLSLPTHPSLSLPPPLSLSLSHSEHVRHSVSRITVDEGDMNPLKPCGACQEWLRKVAEVNPRFRVLTFTDCECTGVVIEPVEGT